MRDQQTSGVGEARADRRSSGSLAAPALDLEGVQAALEVARRVAAGRREGLASCTDENLALLAVMAYLRVVEEAAGRGAWFPLSSGRVLRGVHPEDVQAGCAVVNNRGGFAIDGGPGEETMARAIGAALASREARAFRRRASYRRAGSNFAELAAAVAHRVSIHLAGKART